MSSIWNRICVAAFVDRCRDGHRNRWLRSGAPAYPEAQCALSSRAEPAGAPARRAVMGATGGAGRARPPIRAAAGRIKGAVYCSPCPYSLGLSRLCGCDVYCKLDHLQLTGSFKERGARNKLMLLADEEKLPGSSRTADMTPQSMGVRSSCTRVSAVTPRQI